MTYISWNFMNFVVEQLTDNDDTARLFRSQKPEILTMKANKAKKVYPCPVCFMKGEPYVCSNLGNWYKHTRTSKHKKNLARKENSVHTINGQLNATATGDSSKSISPKKSNSNGNLTYDVQKMIIPDDNNDIASSTTGATKSTKLAKSTSSEIPNASPSAVFAGTSFKNSLRRKTSTATKSVSATTTTASYKSFETAEIVANNFASTKMTLPTKTETTTSTNVMTKPKAIHNAIPKATAIKRIRELEEDNRKLVQAVLNLSEKMTTKSSSTPENVVLESMSPVGSSREVEAIDENLQGLHNLVKGWARLNNRTAWLSHACINTISKSFSVGKKIRILDPSILSKPPDRLARKLNKDVCRLIFPLNLDGMHWVVFVCDLRSRKIFAFDSFNSWAPDDDLTEKITRTLPGPQKWVTKKVKVPQQQNNYDCGIFVLKYIEVVSVTSTAQPLEAHHFKNIRQDHVGQYRREFERVYRESVRETLGIMESKSNCIMESKSSRNVKRQKADNSEGGTPSPKKKRRASIRKKEIKKKVKEETVGESLIGKRVRVQYNMEDGTLDFFEGKVLSRKKNTSSYRVHWDIDGSDSYCPLPLNKKGSKWFVLGTNAD